MVRQRVPALARCGATTFSRPADVFRSHMGDGRLRQTVSRVYTLVLLRVHWLQDDAGYWTVSLAVSEQCG